MWKPEIRRAYIVGTGVKFRLLAGKEYKPAGEFVPNEQVKLLNTAVIEGVKWHRVKRASGEFVWVIDHYLHVPLRQ